MYDGKLVYQLPEDKEVVAKVVELIPSWRVLHGSLYAAKNLYESSLVLPNTAVVFKGYSDGLRYIQFETEDPYKETVPTNVDDLFFGVHLPSHVVFHPDTGFMSDLTVAHLRKIAAGYVRKGYRGSLTAISDFYDNDFGKNPQTMHVFHHSKRIELEWTGRFGGERGNLHSIEEGLEKLGIKCIEPIATD